MIKYEIWKRLSVFHVKEKQVYRAREITRLRYGISRAPSRKIRLMRWGTKEKKFRRGRGGERLSKSAGWNNEPQNARRIRLTTFHCWRDPFLNFFGRSAYFINALIKFSLLSLPFRIIFYLPRPISQLPEFIFDRIIYQVSISIDNPIVQNGGEREKWNWKRGEEECREASCLAIERFAVTRFHPEIPRQWLKKGDTAAVPQNLTLNIS